MASHHQSIFTPHHLQMDASSTKILNGINARLGDIDFKLTVLMDMLGKSSSAGAPTSPHGIHQTAFSTADSTANSGEQMNLLMAANMAAAACTFNSLLPSVTALNPTQTSPLAPNALLAAAAMAAASANHNHQTPVNELPNSLNELVLARMLSACQQRQQRDTPPSTSHTPNGEDNDNAEGNESSPLSEGSNSLEIRDSSPCGEDLKNFANGDEAMNSTDMGNSTPTESPINYSSKPPHVGSNNSTPNGKRTFRQSSYPPVSAISPNVESSFPNGAVKRAAEKAARSFQSTQPKVFAWQILRESIADDELKGIQISLRTFHGESAAHLLSRQLPKIRLVVESTMNYFQWDKLPPEAQLSKAKMLLSHLKNNAKVRNWTLREGRPNRSNNHSTDTVWKRYAALLGPNGLVKMGGFFSGQQQAFAADPESEGSGLVVDERNDEIISTQDNNNS